jgi:hypothetical protein
MGEQSVGVGARRLVAVGLLFALAGCGGGGGQQAAQPPANPPPAKEEGFEVSWLGLLSRTYDGDLALCADAVKASLRKLGLEVTSEKPGIFETTIEAESRDGTSLVVIAKEVTRGTTRVTIKVGYFLGDRDAARRIHSEIEGELQARRAEAEARKRRWGSGTRPPDAPAPQ